MTDLFTGSGGLVLTSGGDLSTVAAAAPGFATSFSLENTNSGGASVGIKKFGLAFKKGDVPSGFKPVLKISAVEMDAYQFNKLQTWDDGSLRWARCHVRESNFSSSETRTVDVTAESGTITSTGALVLSDITGNSDFKIEVTNLKQLEDTKNIVSITKANPAVVEVTGHTLSAGELYILNVGGMTEVNNRKFAFTVQDANHLVLTGEDSTSYGTASGGTIRELTTVGSGSYAAEFNTHSAVATRREVVDDGDVALSYKVWGQVDDDSGGTEHDHLKVVWHITAYDDGIGGILRFEVEAEMRLDWWSVAGKRSLWYDLELFDGVTSIETYTSVHHPYRSRWRTWRKDADVYHGTRHWVGGADPTIHYNLNQAYWASTLIIPAYNWDLDLSAKKNVYNVMAIRPCEGVGGTYDPVSQGGHRDTNISAGGAYSWRGMHGAGDAIAFIDNSPEAVQGMRQCAHSGLHYPRHYMSNNSRTRPTEGADTANTVIALDLLGWPGGVANDPSDYNFTADGMPAAVEAYAEAAAPDQDGYVTPEGGRGIWATVDNAHHTNPSEMEYLIEAEEWAYDVLMSYAQCTVVDGSVESDEPIYWINGSTRTTSWSISNEKWRGIVWAELQNERANAWKMNSARAGAMNVAVGDPQYNYLNAFLDHQFDYDERSISFFDGNSADMEAMGILYCHWMGQAAPWSLCWVVISHCYAYALRRDSARAATVANWVANMPKRIMATNAYYNWSGFREDYYNILNTTGQLWGDVINTVTLDYSPSADAPWIYDQGNWTTNATTNEMSGTPTFDYEVNDTIRMVGVNHNSGPQNVTVPAEFDVTDVYHVIETDGSTIKISETQGGSEFDITTDATAVFFVTQRQAVIETIATVGVKSISNDDAERHGVCSAVMVYNVGLTAKINADNADNAIAFVNTYFTNDTSPQWDQKRIP